MADYSVMQRQLGVGSGSWEQLGVGSGSWEGPVSDHQTWPHEPSDGDYIEYYTEVYMKVLTQLIEKAKSDRLMNWEKDVRHQQHHHLTSIASEIAEKSVERLKEYVHKVSGMQELADVDTGR